MPQLIDTHAHLDSDIYEKDLDRVVQAALENDTWIVTVGNDYDSSKRAVEIAERYPVGVYAAVGLHPKRVSANIAADDKLLNLEKFHELAVHPKVVAVGETGLDFHDLPDDPRRDSNAEETKLIKENQKKVFGKFLDLSRQLRLPLLLHCRDGSTSLTKGAHEEMLEMLETWDKTTPGFDARGILHCFSGGWKEARRYFNLEFMISVTGVLTHGHYQTDIIKRSPLSRLVLESDCPYLTPTPWSLRRCEPRYLDVVASAVAGIRGQVVQEVAAQTTANALKVLSRLLR